MLVPSGPKQPSLARPFALIIGFYVAAGLFIVSPFILATMVAWFAPRLFLYGAGRLLLGWIAVAFFAGLAIVPRRDRTELPGIRLGAREQPGLFQVVNEVANLIGKPVPDHIHLHNKMAASAGFHQGFAGFGSSRFLAIGLPFFRALTVHQMRALLAHELAHLHPGSSFAWAWIAETNKAIQRFLVAFHETSPEGSKLASRVLDPFVRACFQVSREQEFVADSIAAHHFGAQPFQAVLEANDSVNAFWSLYWYAEYLPALKSGFAPPLMDGFEHFCSAIRTRESLRVNFTEFVGDAHEAAYKTHPADDERIRAIQGAHGLVSAGDDRRSMQLLEALPRLECDLVKQCAREFGVTDPQTIPWAHVGAKVYLRAWHDSARRNGAALSGLAVSDIARLARDSSGFGYRILQTPGFLPDRTQCNQLGREVLRSALAAALDRAGWELVYRQAGDERIFEKDGHRFDPVKILGGLATGQLDKSEWLAQSESAGIAHLKLEWAEPRQSVNDKSATA
ncbi:MAG: M48 family metalloprotease [Bryobacteraceae bacterium]|jgi:Zn-dependent protease with chaperone function